MTRRQHGRENKLLVWEGLVKNKANCELVKQALHSFQSYSISGMGKKRAKGFKDLTHITYYLNSHSVNRRSKANKQHWFNSLSDHAVTLVPPQIFFCCDLEILAVFRTLQPELSQKMKSKQMKFHNGCKIPVKEKRMKPGLENPRSSRISFLQSILSPLSTYSCLCKQKDTRCIKASLFL